MQTRRDTSQSEMMLLPSLEEQIPKDYYLRRLNNVLDLSFIHEMVRPHYCQDNGRPSIDPEVIIRLFLLQAVTGITSVRQLLRETNLHLGYRWFIGYGPTEILPDHSSLSRALTRFDDEVFNGVFQRSIEQCRKSGLIEGKLLHIDATTIRADLDSNRVNRPDSPDPDARFGRFPNGCKEPGFKQQTVVDDKSGAVVAIDVMPANVNEGVDITDVLDEALEHLDGPVETLCADSAYASGLNRSECEARGIRLVSPPGWGHSRYSKGHFLISSFTYDELQDFFTCPAGKTLRRIGEYKGKPGRWKYSASSKDCRNCPLKSRCTDGPQRSLNVSVHHGALVRLRQDSQTEDFRRLYRRRAPIVEGVFAQAKQWHGLGRAWRRGLVKVRVQCLLIAAVLNFKRVAGGVLPSFSGFMFILSFVRGLLRLLCASICQYGQIFAEEAYAA